MNAKPYGCHNSERKSHFWVKDGIEVYEPLTTITPQGIQRMKLIQDVSTTECQYRIEKPNDKRCQGCKK